MHIRIKMKSVAPNGQVTLPIHYNHLVQGMIYHMIDKELGTFLHKGGYIENNRKFKMFTFSNLMGSFKINQGPQKTITFLSAIELVITSPIDQLCQSFGTALLKKGIVRLGGSNLQVEEIQLTPTQVTENSILVQTLSPIVVYSTLLKPGGGKYTCYFTPQESMFQSSVKENIKKKWQSFYNTAAPLEGFSIQLVGEHKQNIIMYKGIVIKGSSGIFRLQGHSELLSFILDVGMGSKNAQGFSCLKLLK